MFLNNTNFLGLLLFSEFMWIFLYVFAAFLGTLNDDLLLISLTFYFLGLAGVEFSFGFLLIIMFKHFNESINFKSSLNNINNVSRDHFTSSVGGYSWL